MMMVLVGRYLAVDTQLFTLLPILVLLSHYNHIAGIATCAAAIVSDVTTMGTKMTIAPRE